MASSSVVTRLSTHNSVFGQPTALPQLQLPTKEDVFRCFLFHRDMPHSQDGKTKRDLLRLTASEVTAVWAKASIPTIEQKSVINKMERLVDSGNKLQKYSEEKRQSSSFQSEKRSFKDIFDICTCKCLSSGQLDRDQCRCKVKIPAMEWSFFLDQNRGRKMVIGHVDHEVSVVLQRRMLRKEQQERYKEKQLMTVESSHECHMVEEAEDLESDDSICVSGSSQEHDSSTSTMSSTSPMAVCQNRSQYPNLCQIMDRSGVSNQDACRIINAYLQDMGLNKEENLVEPTKLRRQRRMWRNKEASSHADRLKKLKCVGFDGKIDDTRLYKTRNVQRLSKEDHYVIVTYPEEEYVEHVAPQSGRAQDIAIEIQAVIRDTESVDSLCAVACDSTAVNTGEHGGVIRLLELYLQHPLQWLICMLHLNELPFREVFKLIDGETSGPGVLKGHIGRLLDFDPGNLVVAKYRPVTGITEDMPQSVKSDLSEDQKYLLKACIAVQLGHNNTDPDILKFLSTASPGRLHHARWITRANRILRLYIGTEEPSTELVQLVAYIVNVYAPCWYQIKRHPLCFHGARNFFFIITCNRLLLDESVRNCVETVLTRNCYFAHPENILLAAVTDNDIAIRRNAAQIIVAARKSTDADTVRKFSKSSVILKFDATDYFNMIDWNASAVTSPPALSSLSDEELIESTERGALSVPSFPCQTQAVERMVKEVSRTASKVFGHSARHSMILSAAKSRKRLKSDAKQSFLA